MPAIVIVGAQWGDEGKGKATDLLGEPRRLRREVQRRQQRRPHRRHRRREVRAAPAAVAASSRPGVHAGHRQRRRRRPRGAVRGARRRSSARGVDTSRLRGQRQRARHRRSTTAPSTRSTERFLGKRQIGTTGRGIGPTYADKMNRVGIRIQDLFDENILRQKVEGALELKNQLLAKIYNRRAITVDEIVEELLAYADRLRADGRRHRRCCSTRRSTAARPCCSRPARPPCSTSTTAPTRS